MLFVVLFVYTIYYGAYSSMMESLIVLTVSLMLLNECNYADGDIGTISGYPQVDVRELNALTLSWNQVKYGNNFYFLRL